MSQDSPKVIEKHYIEVPPSAKKRFMIGLIQGLGWGIGLTLGTSIILVVIGFFASRVDFVPVLGQFLSDVIQSANSQRR